MDSDVMFAYVFTNYKDEFVIFESPFIGETITPTARNMGLFIIYIAM